MSPNLVERQMRRVRNGVAYLAGVGPARGGADAARPGVQRDKARLWRYRSDRRTVSGRRC